VNPFRSGTRAAVADPQRTLARVVLGALLALLLVVVAMPLGRSLAQGAPTIEIVNPDETTSLVISDQEFPYHLNSWVSQVPTGAIVEYELTASNNVTTTIGTATQTTGRPDTFEFFWQIPDTIADGDYTLRATLFQRDANGNPTEVAEDEDAVVINQSDEDIIDNPDPATNIAAENVEIQYPTNGGPLGTYITPDGKTGSFIIEVNASAGTRFVQGFYSTAPAGSEPAFEACGTFRSVTTTDRPTLGLTFECTVAPTDFALDVTAVAVTPNDTPSPASATQAQTQFTDAADAHTVDTYFQRAGAVAVAPTSAGNTAPGTCQQIVATVTDQMQRPIANINVDVHAEGPSDQLRFDTTANTSDQRTDAVQPPDKGNHGSDTAARCANNGTSATTGGSQGEHAVPDAPDEKHVESVNHTDETGRFFFALTSDVAGETHVTTWADEDDDDLFCSQEQSGVSAIGWGQVAPTPTADEPDVATCLRPEPTPGATTSPTASATATATATATASASPSVSPTTSPGDQSGERTISSFDSNKRRARKDARVVFRGTVTADDQRCSAEVTVKLKAKRGDGRFKTIKATFTEDDGNFIFNVNVRKTKTYRAIAPQDGICEFARSRTVKVRVRS